MREELQEQLKEKYPNVMKEWGGDPRKTCMAWGIECGDGWYDIIDELCAKLEPMGVVAAQVKEKFGGLRFYINPVEEGDWDTIHNAINEAEAKSYETCEKCGKPGKVVRGGWVSTLCDECNKAV